MSWKILSALHFIFYFCLQTNEQCYRLLRLTNHSSAFQPVSGMKLNMLLPTPVSGTRKVWQTDQFLVPVDWYQKQAPETGQCVITISLNFLQEKVYSLFSGQCIFKFCLTFAEITLVPAILPTAIPIHFSMVWSAMCLFCAMDSHAKFIGGKLWIAHPVHTQLVNPIAMTLQLLDLRRSCIRPEGPNHHCLLFFNISILIQYQYELTANSIHVFFAQERQTGFKVCNFCYYPLILHENGCRHINL